MHVTILTLFPEYFREPLSASIPGRARRKGLFSYEIVDLREYAEEDGMVDDYPYGGGGGMVMKPEPVFRAYEALGEPEPFVLLSARGRVFDHRAAVRHAVEPHLTLLCGHYKDVDERVRETLVTDEISLGDFVLSGGEIAALAVIDAIVRLLPGVIGDFDSAQSDSFHDEWLLGAPSYTRPAEYRGMAVPEVLLSGDHSAIERWRRERSIELTREIRPDLLEREARETRPEGPAGPQKNLDDDPAEG